MLGLDLDTLVAYRLFVAAPVLAGQHFGGVFMVAHVALRCPNDGSVLDCGNRVVIVVADQIGVATGGPTSFISDCRYGDQIQLLP